MRGEEHILVYCPIDTLQWGSTHSALTMKSLCFLSLDQRVCVKDTLKATLLIFFADVISTFVTIIVNPVSCGIVINDERNQSAVVSSSSIFSVPPPRSPRDHRPIVLTPNTF